MPRVTSAKSCTRTHKVLMQSRLQRKVWLREKQSTMHAHHCASAIIQGVQTCMEETRITVVEHITMFSNDKQS